ncbi:MAG: mitochondrial fission ELM1 family protein [Verrucomicrobia bacterium]|nr:mitochondrial fission ELM1 family protein [Verrucomicrobiota bacterium]
MSEPLQLLIISDGKTGHLNQSLGFAEAMGRICATEINILELDFQKGFFSRLRGAVAASEELPQPNMVIATGHATHFPLLWISRKSGAGSIVLMKPSLPMSWFDFCIAPEHDFEGKAVPGNVITSKGALNRVVSAKIGKKGKLFLIGGPSKTHGYDQAALISQIAEIVGDEPWQLADSRRTPPTLLPALAATLPTLEIFPHGEAKPGWLAGKLSELEEIRVTEDSVSMIYEALSSGAKVGVLEMPRLLPDSRVLRGLAALEKEGYLDPTASPKILAEADRCAKLLFG